MRRTTSPTAVLLAILSPAIVLVAPAPATAAGETCQGVAATIVGTPEGHVVGTAGDDVIVSNVAWSVDAGAGDDLICLSPAEGELLGNVVEVDAGAGDDVVVSEGARNHSHTDLGPGRDEFHGGGWDDRVAASLDDTIVVDRGDDYVTYSIGRKEELPAVVGRATAHRKDGWVGVRAPGRRLVIDSRAGTIRLDGRVVVALPVSPRMLSGAAQSVTIIGTPGVDRIATAACGRSTLVGLGGDDEFVALGDRTTPHRDCPRRHMRAEGGGGDDVIHGTMHDDDLRGGPGDDAISGHGGNDEADGGPGRDKCVRTERERSCER